ncbi:thioredoxin [uncultured Ruthenibacterium sp.]|uniref:thioredoxin n=1 Tax=uncultured Ruthenibacterium sp. TaxID=1905347 RepID=UPI00349E5A37
MAIRSITNAEFETMVLNAQQPVLVDFWAPWCVYCRRLAPVLDRMDGQQDIPQIVKINIDEEPQLAERYKIDTIPTLLLFQNGKQGQPLVAPASQAQIQEWLKQQN